MNPGATLEHARAAKCEAARVFRELVGEVAVGIVSLGHDQYGFKVNLATEPAEGISLPAEVDGVPVRVEVVGTIQKR